MTIVGNMVGCYSPIGKTFIIVDDDNNEYMGVVVDQEVILTATDSDVLSGKIYVGDDGVSTGTLECTCNGYDNDAQMFCSSASGRIPEYERGVATNEFELYFETSAVGVLQE